MEDTDLADMPPRPDTGDDTDLKPNRGSTTRTPRWVKASGVIALVLVLLFVVLLLTGGEHGPGRHTESGAPGGHTQNAVVTERGEQEP